MNNMQRPSITPFRVPEQPQMPDMDFSQLGNLMMMLGGMAPQMPQQQIPPQMYQMQQPMARMAAPSMMYAPQPSGGLQVPTGYTYDPRTGTQYGQQQGGSNNLQYTYPGTGLLGAGAYRPHTG